jgi:hypothetical protein
MSPWHAAAGAVWVRYSEGPLSSTAITNPNPNLKDFRNSGPLE